MGSDDDHAVVDVSSGEDQGSDSDDDAPRKRADRLLRGCGEYPAAERELVGPAAFSVEADGTPQKPMKGRSSASRRSSGRRRYADRLLAELRRAGLAATRGGALAAAAMGDAAPAADAAAPTDADAAMADAAPAATPGVDARGLGRAPVEVIDVDADDDDDAAPSIDGFRALDAAEAKRVCSQGLELRAHQLVGVNWLLLLERVGACGVLADDMGLGKTVQTIAYRRPSGPGLR